MMTVGRYGSPGLVAALFVLTLWTDDYTSRSQSSGNPCVLVVRYSRGQLCASDVLTLFGAQFLGVAAGFKVAYII